MTRHQPSRFSTAESILVYPFRNCHNPRWKWPGRFAWPNDVNLDLGSASIALVIHQNRNTAILKHSVNFAESCPNGRQTILYLLITASCVIHTRINILTTLTFEGNTWKILSYCLLNPAWNLPESQQFNSIRSNLCKKVPKYISFLADRRPLGGREAIYVTSLNGFLRWKSLRNFGFPGLNKKI